MVSIKARAKVNLVLDIASKRPDGYHEVDMIMHKIDLYDVITVEQIENGIHITSDSGYLPLGESNIAYKAAKLMMDTYNLKTGFSIDIQKNIPVAAGLAGGSTDAAAVVDAIDSLMNLGMTIQEKMDLGVKLGADVPFCFLDKPARARGIGEKLDVLKPVSNIYIVLTKPSISVSTKDVYMNLVPEDYEHHPDVEGMIKAMQKNNIYDISSMMGNVLEKSTFRLYPQVEKLKGLVKSFGSKGTLMSGSGPSVYGLYSDKGKATSAYKNLKKTNPQTYLTTFYQGGE